MFGARTSTVCGARQPRVLLRFVDSISEIRAHDTSGVHRVCATLLIHRALLGAFSMQICQVQGAAGIEGGAPRLNREKKKLFFPALVARIKHFHRPGASWPVAIRFRQVRNHKSDETVVQGASMVFAIDRETEGLAEIVQNIVRNPDFPTPRGRRWTFVPENRRVFSSTSVEIFSRYLIYVKANVEIRS